MPWRCLWPVGPDLPWMLSVGGAGAVGGSLPWSERPLGEVSLASCDDSQGTLNFTPYDDCVSAQGYFSSERTPVFDFQLGDGDDVMVLSDAEDIYVDGEGGDDTITCLAGADCDRIKDYY